MGLSWKSPDTVVPGVLLLGAIVYGTTAWGYDLGTGSNPGPGLFPFAVAIAVVLSSATWLVTVARERPRPQDQPTPSAPPAGHDDPGLPSSVATAEEGGPEEPDETLDWPRIGGVAVAALLVIPLSTWIGLVPAAGVLATATAALMRVRLVVAVVVGLVFGVLAYLVFEQWLDVPLPNGFLLTQGGIT
ncbi:tripartite tricarboxylate transporter TctB family protein [Blastococcus goldschmidtiae]|uniref:Tripartite tricarboxylate transporter TctB family protein n=1 Tax=Blastococcus goldschmidtiae TaxID=3075546 RepID=A0ABU2K6V8_9ACTN|nr:tripartite tricarboxylate transporter TctB family protein [Blastococcus sp. DSM 46792]MDT0275931.1 tripartite tricarboxylate transporter TctB family protein [Blastococcus sp. DSM 46792]